MRRRGLLLLAALVVSWGCDDGGDNAPDDDGLIDAARADGAAADAAAPDASIGDAAADAALPDAQPDAQPDAAVDAAADAAPDAGPPEPEPLPFPEDFLFGTATAGFQVEMGCPTLPAEDCEDRNSDWYAFVTAPETIASNRAFLSGDPVSYGPGFWETYAADFDLAKDDLHNDAFRMSIEWSRVFPQPTDAAQSFEDLRALADPDALAGYHAILDALKARGMTPLVTISHYTLPAWIHDGVGCHLDLDACSPRGWLDRERTVTEIAKYAGFVAQEFGDDIDLYATLNEPFALLLPGYLLPSAERTNPPAVSLRFDEGKEVLVALIEGHARMYDAIKAADPTAQVGVVYNLTPAKPADPDEPADVEAAANFFYLWNEVFMNGVAGGLLDDDLDGEAEARPDLAGRMDYVGVNYYTRVTVDGLGRSALPALSPLATFNPLSLVLWEDYPKGLYEMIAYVDDAFDLPVIVTENGTMDPFETRPSFLVRHLTWVARALRDGYDVRGYFFWSLMDNYEWNHGLGLRFGLYGYDPEDPTKAREKRAVADTYGRIAEERAIPLDLQAEYPAP